ncbi:MAG TPA: hypothetical protein VLR94_06760 [Acidobacteriota bacterium]|nr:hypothetical protein [Acidobacteriota bacterium]
MKVNSSACSQATQVSSPADVADAPVAQEAQETTAAGGTERDAKLSTEKKSDIDLSGKLMANQLSAKAQSSQNSSKTPAAQEVEHAMEHARANGGGTREAIVAGAKADAGHVDVGSYSIQKGEDRLKEVYKTSGYSLEKNQKYDRTGQPIVQLKEGKGSSSWCGVWATDIWKRAGCDVKWVAGQGPYDVKNKKSVPQVAVGGNNDKALQNVKPGDMIVINSYDANNPNKMKTGTTNHHAIVTDSVYEAGGKTITCPPAAVPQDGKLIGFHTMNGNSPGVPQADGSNPAIREGYIDLTKKDVYTDDKDQKQYEKRISGYYPVPEPKTTSV